MSSVDSNIDIFIDVSKRFLGAKEGTTQHSIIIALYNSYRPKGEYEMTLNDSWCAAFVGAMSGVCGLGGKIPISASCSRMITRFREMGAKMVSTPEKGDIAFFDWSGSGSYDDHVGIVVSVENGNIRTIEGNHNDSVSYRDFMSGPVIFFRPLWSDMRPTPEPEEANYREYYTDLTWEEKNEVKGLPTLKLGSVGIYVKILQDFIGVDMDGTFGPETSKALLEYQCQMQLEADAICGRQTWSSFFA